MEIMRHPEQNNKKRLLKIVLRVKSLATGLMKLFNEDFIRKDSKRMIKFANPVENHIDVKITYACNYKCEYCYQVDDDGHRFKGVFEEKNINNLINFMKKTKLKYIVSLVGGEPFMYPRLNEFAQKLIKNGHRPNIITNFSAPFEKIEEFINIVKNNLFNFGISIHISQINSTEAFLLKLGKLMELKGIWPVWITCVITEENFDKAIEIGEEIKKTYGITVYFQRVYYREIYNIYSERIENYFKTHNIDVPKEKTGNINFFGNYCWCGIKSYYIDHNGDVHRCYTPQACKNNGILGNLSKYRKIKIFKKPYPCLSSDNGNCICFKHFIDEKYVTNYICTNAELKNIPSQILPSAKQKLIEKKNKYKMEIENKC
ncbi:MAG: radical SAM protein [Candidatus Margulisbacteria bacterium]|nr:radical SAM protein [Candidatus Margulisiibacteriota bacterium]